MPGNTAANRGRAPRVRALLRRAGRGAMLSVLAASACAAFAQATPPAAAAATPALLETLQAGGRHWSLTHVCVLPEVALRYTNEDFADAIVAAMTARWERGMENRADAASLVGAVGHAATDLYWPGRVERNARGQIVRFRPCGELGGAEGLRSAEARPVLSVLGDAEVRRKAADLLAGLRLVHRRQRSFADFVDELRRDALMIEPGRERDPLGR